MVKKMVVVLAAFLLVSACTFGVGASADPSVELPQPVEATSPCPAAGCASGSCHGFDAVPKPDGAHEMVCPEVGCASAACHGWDTLVGRYHQASDASLNVWILTPALLVVGLVLLTKKL